MMRHKIVKKSLLLLLFGQVACYLLYTATGFASHSAWAAEPNMQLFSDRTEERQVAYTKIEETIAEKLAIIKDEKEKENLLVQQQILARLQELPDKPKQRATSRIFSELAGKEKLSWEELEQYLNRYIETILGEEMNRQALENGSRQIKILRNRLTTLAADDPATGILQLQHAYKTRKQALQQETARQLKDALKLAQKLYPLVLSHTQVDSWKLDEEEKILADQRAQFQNIVDDEALSATGNNIKIQQQENVLNAYSGRDLTVDEKKLMVYDQLKLIELQVNRLFAGSQRHANNLKRLQQEQKVAWFLIISEKPDFLDLTDLSNDILKQIILLKKETSKSQNDIYSLEKDLVTPRNNTEFIGPRAKKLVGKMDTDIREIFAALTLIDQQADVLDHRGWLLGKAIDQKQTGIGAVVTKTREATDNVFERIIFILKYPIVTYSGVSISLLVLLQAAFLLILGYLLNRFYGKIIYRIGQQRSWAEQTVHMLQAAGKYPLFFIIALIVLSVLGINTSSFAMIAGALSVGIGFGLKTIVNNLISGVILLFDKSIRPGDFISLGGNLHDEGLRGNVVQMSIRATVLRTNDNINVIIPNADLIEAQVVNWTYSDEKVRFKIPFSVAYGTDVDQIKHLVKEAMLQAPIVLKHPEPSILMSAHGDNALVYNASVWVEGPNARRPARTIDTILSNIYKVLSKHNIEIPFPQRVVHIKSDLPETKESKATTQ